MGLSLSLRDITEKAEKTEYIACEVSPYRVILKGTPTGLRTHPVWIVQKQSPYGPWVDVTYHNFLCFAMSTFANLAKVTLED